MKRIILKLILPALIGAYFSTAFAQVDEDVLNWYNTKKTGMSTEKAYKKIRKITPDTVIVAIIDSGIDIEHEDLQGKIWTNTKEIPNNGIDDDGNGYIDDIHGWNFLGSKDGKHQGPARLEVTRIYAKLKPRFEDVEATDVSNEDRKDYELYLETKKAVEDNTKKYEGIIVQTKQFKEQMLPMIPGMIENMLGKEDYTQEDLEEWEPEDAQGKQMKRIALQLLSGELTAEVIDKQIEPNIARQKGGSLVLPIVGFDKKLKSLQFIKPDGSKLLLAGGQKRGCVIPIQQQPATHRILICEGFATGVSLAEMEPESIVLAAIDAGNLKTVAAATRELWPAAQIVICADADEIGLAKAKAAALSVGALLAVPEFPPNAIGSDFNDLANMRGGHE
jgi:hypothetical protein